MTSMPDAAVLTDATLQAAVPIEATFLTTDFDDVLELGRRTLAVRVGRRAIDGAPREVVVFEEDGVELASVALNAVLRGGLKRAAERVSRDPFTVYMGDKSTAGRFVVASADLGRAIEAGFAQGARALPAPSVAAALSMQCGGRSRTIDAKVGDLVDLAFEEEGSTGYLWRMLAGSTPAGLVGLGFVRTGKTKVYRFRADAPGVATLRFVNRRPWLEGKPGDDPVIVERHVFVAA